MSKQKFPALIHVTDEAEADGSNPYLMVLHGGVSDVDEPGREVAIYRRVSVGRVKIAKSFIERKGAQR